MLESHWSYVYNYLLNKTDDVYTTEELCIQTFAKAFDKIDKYNEEYNFKTWLITICKRLWIDHQRKKELKTTKINKQVSFIKSDDASIEDALIQDQYIKTIKLALNTLKPDDKNALIKRLFEDKSYAEIAEEMDDSVNAIKVKIFRAKRKLIKIIQNQYPL
ncbi:RNA polymerase sigma factor [Mesohalobacter salilacus]|uniref:RNA polymerase sigma factor n=1 Tax=Mesohalobacter salilacus TaxID=2491711 RepID=UPI0026C0F8AD